MFENLENYLDVISKLDEFSGVVLVSKENKIVFEYATGFSNRSQKHKNTIETKFNIGSISKLFTAVAICQLVEQNKISFQDTVSKFLLDYPNKIIKDEATIKHLLTHTSGLGSFINTKYLKDYLKEKENLKSPADIVRFFENHKLESSPGNFVYSANGYELLGLILEKVTGSTYYEYVNEKIFKKANMLNTVNNERRKNNVGENSAIGYTQIDYLTGRRLNKKVENWDRLPVRGTASGSAYSTAPDLLNFANAFMQGKLITEEMRDLMLKPHISEGSFNGISKYTGYGFVTFSGEDYKRIGHAGQFDGVSARLDVYPDDKITIVVLSNYDAPSAFDVAKTTWKFVRDLD